MKKLLLIVFCVLIYSENYGQNVNVKDYQVPVSKAKILRLTGSYNFSQSNTDSTKTVNANNASATVYFRYFYSSLPFAYFIDADATGGKVFGDYTHDVSIRPSIRKYFDDKSDFFGFGSLFLRHANTFKQIQSDLLVGGGYGRYINATALAKAVRIEQHLVKENVVSGFLPKETMIEIANIIEREDEYRGVYGETYEKNWYEDIEKSILKSGKMIGEHLGAIGILRMQQVLKNINERVNERFYGWDVTLGVLFNVSTSDKSDTRSPALSIGGRYSHPISWSSQINSFLNVSTPFDSTFFKDVRGELGIDYIYELSNKINFIGGYRLNYTKPNVGDGYADHFLNGSFIFYMENSINLGINATLASYGLSTVKRTDFRTSVTLQYNLF